MAKQIKKKNIEHPAEEVFDIEPGSTLVEYEESLPVPLVEANTYDEKDREIEEQLEDIRAKALDAFEMQSEIAETVEGKYSARNSEVAANFLTTALQAIKEKAEIKKHKDKSVIAAQRANTPGTLNQNVVIDHKSLIKMLKDTDE